jgi:DNA-binding NarL/FixJ family response regulator
MTGICVAIVDDEPLARARLRRLLSSMPEIKIVAECANGKELVSLLTSSQVDAVFLDIQMPDGNAFSILETIPEPHPDIVFVTAHNSHAVQAFEVQATDYLVKPISLERLRIATERLKPKVTAKESQHTPSHHNQNNINVLSNREIEVLRLAAIGKTSWEISSILEISERTVNFHLNNTAAKLGVNGRRAACSLAISKGLISL